MSGVFNEYTNYSNTGGQANNMKAYIEFEGFPPDIP